MTATAGYRADLFVTGAALSMTGESMSDTGDGVTYEVATAARDVWNWRAPLIVKVDGSTVSASTYNVNYLFGQVVFNSAPGGTVTVDGEFLPKYRFALGREASFDDTVEELDITVFQDDHIQRMYGLADVEGSLTGLSLLNEEIGTGEKTLREVLKDRDFIVLSYSPDSEQTFTQRAVIMFTNASLSAAVDGLVESTLDFQGAAPRDMTGEQVSVEYKS